MTPSGSPTGDRTPEPSGLSYLDERDRAFLGRGPLEVAPELLGLFLVAGGRDDLVGGRIVEVEAYLGPEDAASHAFRGETRRNRAMFGLPGLLYVYFSYGMHHCCNVVCLPEGSAGAVLIRALEPTFGLDEMARRRSNRRTGRIPRSATVLCSGPGKLCQALGIDRSDDGTDLLAAVSRVRLARAPGRRPEVTTGRRIGIAESLATADAPWRFYDSASAHLSRRARRTK